MPKLRATIVSELLSRGQALKIEGSVRDGSDGFLLVWEIKPGRRYEKWLPVGDFPMATLENLLCIAQDTMKNEQPKK